MTDTRLKRRHTPFDNRFDRYGPPVPTRQWARPCATTFAAAGSASSTSSREAIVSRRACGERPRPRRVASDGAISSGLDDPGSGRVVGDQRHPERLAAGDDVRRGLDGRRRGLDGLHDEWADVFDADRLMIEHGHGVAPLRRNAAKGKVHAGPVLACAARPGAKVPAAAQPGTAARTPKDTRSLLWHPGRAPSTPSVRRDPHQVAKVCQSKCRRGFAICRK